MINIPTTFKIGTKLWLSNLDNMDVQEQEMFTNLKRYL